MCVDMLSNKLCVQSAAATLILADTYGEAKLKETVLAFINVNLDVLTTTGFQNMNDPQLLHETLKSVSTYKSNVVEK